VNNEWVDRGFLDEIIDDCKNSTQYKKLKDIEAVAPEIFARLHSLLDIDLQLAENLSAIVLITDPNDFSKIQCFETKKSEGRWLFKLILKEQNDK